MSDLKQKTKEHIDSAAAALKKTSDKVVEKSNDLAHSAGKKLEEGAQKLKDA